MASYVYYLPNRVNGFIPLSQKKEIKKMKHFQGYPFPNLATPAAQVACETDDDWPEFAAVEVLPDHTLFIDVSVENYDVCLVPSNSETAPTNDGARFRAGQTYRLWTGGMEYLWHKNAVDTEDASFDYTAYS